MPSQFFCHSCAIRLGHIQSVTTTSPNLTGSAYQFGKYIKHTMPCNYAGVLSVFDRPDYLDYQKYTVSGLLSGCCEIDTQGRANLIWYAGRHVGMTFKNGRYFCPDDAIKVVLQHDITLIHTFPANYELHCISRCLDCNTIIHT